MFVLKREEFANNNYSNVVEFINYWKQYYINTPPRVIDESGRETNDYIYYENELNAGGNLTDQNVTRILRWKMWRTYTHPKKNNGTANTKVTTVLGKIQILNQFRRGELNEDAFKQTAEQLIRTNSTMQIFLFHICRPWEYPIADQHVFRAFYLLERNLQEDTVTWETYKNGYIPFFQRIAEKYHERPNMGEDIRGIVKCCG
jgi:hypothetical protein